MTDQDPFAGGTSAKALSFKDAPIGTSYTGTVLELPELVQSRDFETDEPAFWPAKPGQAPNPKMAAVVKLEVDGETRSLWAIKPSALFAAVQAAQDASGRIQVGTRLTVTYVADKPNENPRLNPAKQYTVTLVHPDAFSAPAPAAAAPVEPAAPAALGSIAARPPSVPEAVWATLSNEQKIALAAVNA
jgi:hypothetical protein